MRTSKSGRDIQQSLTVASTLCGYGNGIDINDTKQKKKIALK